MKNWKTTVFGLIAAVAIGLQNYTGHGGWQGYLSAGAIAAFGFLSKDFNL